MEAHKDHLKMNCEKLRDNAASLISRGKMVRADLILDLLAVLGANEASQSEEPGDPNHWKLATIVDVSDRVRRILASEYWTTL